MRTVSKADIVTKTAFSIGRPRKEAARVLETLLHIIKETLGSGESLLISGFGKFEIRHKHSRKNLNPATGSFMNIPARRKVVFRSSAKFRERINAQ